MFEDPTQAAWGELPRVCGERAALACMSAWANLLRYQRKRLRELRRVS